ncbi:MAG: CDP-alcohol phosphatidyltransferase family protein [Elusimicrobiales bacterium]|nr:CDP-alcohol phosphatidyltransferase family protein [Elusimicrobiales bacterium]
MELQTSERTQFYKDIRIEDFFDIYFYHPIGFKFALFFRNINLSPNFVSVISMFVGILGGFLIYMDYFLFGSIFIVLSSIFDSTDGQLARMKNISSYYGRIIDGICGYVVFISVYIAIYLKFKHIYGELNYLLLMFIAGVSNIMHSSVYDFYRTSFLAVKKNDYLFLSKLYKNKISFLYSIYLCFQNILVGKHIKLLRIFESMNKNQIFEKSKNFYEENMLSTMQLVNILGDNWKINGLILLSLIGRIDLFFWYVIIILNLIFIIVILIQRKKESVILNFIRERL